MAEAGALLFDGATQCNVGDNAERLDFVLSAGCCDACVMRVWLKVLQLFFP